MSVTIYSFTIKNTTNLWENFDNTLFIDPGFNTGMVFCKSNKSGILLELISINAPGTYYDIDYRYEVICKQLFESIERNQVNQIICEDIFFRAGSMKSIGAVMSQDLFKTPQIIGMIRACSIFNKIRFLTIHAHIWKGQLNDEAVKIRVVQKILPILTRDTWFDNATLNSHLCAALGIMLHHVGLFNQEKKRVY